MKNLILLFALFIWQPAFAENYSTLDMGVFVFDSSDLNEGEVSEVLSKSPLHLNSNGQYRLEIVENFVFNTIIGPRFVLKFSEIEGERYHTPLYLVNGTNMFLVEVDGSHTPDPSKRDNYLYLAFDFEEQAETFKQIVETQDVDLLFDMKDIKRGQWAHSMRGYTAAKGVYFFSKKLQKWKPLTFDGIFFHEVFTPAFKEQYGL